ncbi:MAG TPA: CHAT domain-containing protein [Myxococcaceae bacterium]|jgi:CHAT domain-containing protein
MIFGAYGKGGGLVLPRVVTITIARAEHRLPSPGQPLPFLLRFHEEGTCITWHRDVTVSPEEEQRFLADVAILDQWTAGTGGDVRSALGAERRLGMALYDTFVGEPGRAFLAVHEPTALMVDVDETMLSLPWELLRDPEGVLLSTRYPFGRIVSTRRLPRRERDPVEEDRRLRVLAVLNPSGDVAFMESELAALHELDQHDQYQLDVLEGRAATRAALAEAVRPGDYDVIHFSGHGGFDERRPANSGLLMADGPLATEEILALQWAKPPYFVVNSACWSSRAAPGKRLVWKGQQGNGVAAAFLAAGAAAFAGFFWPVSMRAARAFAGMFYGSLLRAGSVGEAFRRAREAVITGFEPAGDLSGSGAVLFGDAATGQRRDLQLAT